MCKITIGLQVTDLNLSTQAVIGLPELQYEDSFPPASNSKGLSHFSTARSHQRMVEIYWSMTVPFYFGGLFLSAREDYSQQVSADSFEWLVSMSMCEQWSCLTSVVLMRQLQMRKGL